MAVYNLQPGAVMPVVAGMIQGRAHVYRTGDGYDGNGTAIWSPDHEGIQVQDLTIGHTVTFAIHGDSGKLANGCASRVQVLWDNAVPIDVRDATPNALIEVLRGRAVPALQEAVVTPPAGASAKQAMATLTAQWYNAVVTGCHLDPSTFQLFQGNVPLGSTSESLWNIFDVVPPLSVSNFYNPSQSNVFSSDYGGVINNLNPQNADSFSNAMGDYLARWNAYLNTNPIPLPQGGMLQLFYNWSQMHMPPDKAQKCYTLYQQIAQGVVPTAVQMWLDSGGMGDTKAYNVTIDSLNSALSSAPSASVQMNSATESTDIEQTWAKTQVGGIFGWFWGEASTNYDELTTTIITAGLTITASFQHLLTVTGAPLSRPSTDPILSSYKPWYSSEALALAYHNNNNVVWKNGPPTWSNTFDPTTGNMLRTMSALVIVDGITITTKSGAGFSTSQQKQFMAATHFGFWPFFEANGSGGWTHDTSFDDSGNLTIQSTCPTGNPNILGAIVTPIGGVMLL